jgi:serine/threonine protein kinase
LEAKGFGHNDIKPPNVMINAKGDPVLIDVGAADKVGKSVTRGAQRRGTMGYGGNKIGEKTGGKHDVYAVGGMARVAGGDRAPNPAEAGWKWVLDSPSKKLFNGGAVVKGKKDKSEKGHYAAQNAYTDFVKATYAEDPKKRPTLAQALKLPFLTDPMLPEEEARKALLEIARHKDEE